MENNHKQRDKSSVLLRLVAGLYLLYLVYGMAGDLITGQTVHFILIFIAAIVFGMIGIVLVATSCRYLYKYRNAE